MKVARLAVAVVALIMLAQVGQAVTLQEAWYAELPGVSVYGIDPDIGLTGVQWNYTGDFGTVGPFEIAQAGRGWPRVSVPASIDVESGTSIYLYGDLVVPYAFPIEYLNFSFDTSYDQSLMRLQAITIHQGGQEEVLWSQGAFDPSYDTPEVLHPNLSFSDGDSLAFRLMVMAVPEPTSFVAVALPLLAVLVRRRRRANNGRR